MFQFQKMWMFQSVKHNFKELTLILWIMIPEHTNKYGNIMLINVMKFDGLTLEKVRTNLLQRHSKKVESAIVAFKLLGLEIIQNGLNILLQQMQLIVYPALSFIIQMWLWDKIHLLLVDLEIGKRLGAKIVLFKFIQEKILTQLIELLSKCVRILSFAMKRDSLTLC